MPEGHTIHRLARDHRPVLVGRAVRAASPQGRFATGAEMLTGRVVEGIEPYGKHLFYSFEGDVLLHVHLGLYGSFTRGTGPAPEPRGALRLRMLADDGAEGQWIDLRGPTACELFTPHDRDAVVARLGPDPLRKDADPERAWRRISGSRTVVGALLMDQSVLAGVGNVYRAEVLYLHRLDPRLPARDVPQTTYEGLWETLRSVMARGVRVGHILTADVADDTTPEEGRYVYKRAVCLGCGGPVRAWDVASRTVYACEREQLDGGGRATP